MMKTMVMVVIFGDGEYSQHECVCVVNVDVVMPTSHVTDHVVRLSNRHRNSFDRQQSSCTHTHTHRDARSRRRGRPASVSAVSRKQDVRAADEQQSFVVKWGRVYIRIQGGPKTGTLFVRLTSYAFTSSNIDRFSNYFIVL